MSADAYILHVKCADCPREETRSGRDIQGFTRELADDGWIVAVGIARCRECAERWVHDFGEGMIRGTADREPRGLRGTGARPWWIGDPLYCDCGSGFERGACPCAKEPSS